MLKKIFKIDKDFYPEGKIQEVISEFEGFSIKLLSPGELEIQSEEDPQMVFDEFMNYLLAYLNE